MKYNAKELRDLPPTTELPDIERYPLYLILDGVYDTYNIGGLFRLADALAISKLYICGDSETPPNHRIKKASIGTYKVVPWEYKNTALDAINDLRKSISDIQIVAVELDERSTNYATFNYSSPLAIIVGNETHGISQDTQAACDATLEIPMHGFNISMNVIVSAAIVASHAHHKLWGEP